MRRRKIISVFLVLTVALGAGYATYASFTSGAAAVSPTMRAGTVNVSVERDQGDAIPGPMFYTTPAEGTQEVDPYLPGINPTGLWYPGKSETRAMIVRNTGSLPFRIYGLSATITDPTPLDGMDDTRLREALIVQVSVVPFPGGLPLPLWEGPLAALTAGGVVPVGPPAPPPPLPPPPPFPGTLLMPTSSVPLLYRVTMPLGAGNDYQGLRGIVGFSVHVRQM